MRAAAEFQLHGFFLVVAENLFHAWTYKGVMAAGIRHENEIGETVHPAAGKFLLLIKAVLHLAALGDVHDRTVVANHVAGGVAHGASGVQANDLTAIFAGESNLAALDHRLTVDLLAQGEALGFVGKEIGEGAGKQVFLGIIAEHAGESGVNVEEVIVRRRYIDAFLQRLEKLGEARFIVAQGGDVASEHGDALNLVVAQHGVRDAVKIIDRVAVLEADGYDSGPNATLEKTRHGPLEQIAAVAGALVEEVAQWVADNLRKGRPNKIGEAAVDSANLSVE